VTDDRRIGEIRNGFIAGINVRNGRIDNHQFANIRVQGRAAVIVDRSREQHLHIEDSLFVISCCRTWRDRRHAVHPRDPRPAGSLPQQR
jgi:hypothetical protein